MSLRDLAARDAKMIVKSASGFSIPATVTAPDATVFSIRGHSKDIHLAIDPETGLIISGRTVTFTFDPDDIAGKTVVGVRTGAPWKVTFSDVNAVSNTFKVEETFPDRTLGVTVAMLTLWEAS